MEPWALSVLSLVIGLAGGVIGAFVGVRVAVGRLEERMRVAEQEIAGLRQAKHEHAGFLTRHEMKIVNIERQLEK